MRTPRPIVLVDADSIVYRVGFAAQKTVIHDVIEHDFGMEEMHFEGKLARNAYLREHPTHTSVADPVEEVLIQPIENALQTVKQTILRMQQLGPTRLFLTGTGNYRDKIATLAVYKGNRDPSLRPVHYEAIRQYMVDYHGAIVINGREADDEVAIMAAHCWDEFKSYVIASIDKDLDQIPGRHFNYVKDVEYAVTEEEAERWFYVQALAGDPGDNVPGCWKVGMGKAEKIVDDQIAHEGHLDHWHMWERIVETYTLATTKSSYPWGDRDPAAMALETAQLVYLQQRVGELWQPGPEQITSTIGADADD